MEKKKIRRLKLSNNLLLALVLILIAINTYTFIISSKDTVTGRVSGTTHICISTTPIVGDPSPQGSNIVINGTYNSSINANNTEYIKFNYFRAGTAEYTFGTDYDPDGDDIFNSTFNTSTVAEGNCDYQIVARAFGYCGSFEVRTSSRFSVNNIDIPPDWSTFYNNMSTNFSQYSSWATINSANITIPEYGAILFDTKNFDNANLSRMFNISYNNITANVSWRINNCFNDVLYEMKIYNTQVFADPAIFKNGARCDDRCYNLVSNGNNHTFVVRLGEEYAELSIGEGGNLTINFTSLNITKDNSPTMNFSTYMSGRTKNVSIASTCQYKTDYDPIDFVIESTTATINHSVQLPEQNWSYLPTNLGRYAYIQHHEYYTGIHTLTVNCSIGYQEAVQNMTFDILPMGRDRVYYSDGDEARFFMDLEEPGLTINVNLSQVDSNFDPGDVTVINDGNSYNISYNISQTNTFPDGQYSVTVEAFNSTGQETMNGSIFFHLHNNWQRSDIDNAFDCWNFKQGYHFDEVACNWESDLNQVADLVDVFTIEISCYDGIDNDLDGKIDINDTDCAGIYYDLRRQLGIDSAFLADPCFNNVCRVCVGANDLDGNGVCDSSDGVNVQYLNFVQPGQRLKVKYLKNSINGESVRVSINFLNDTFNISDSTSSIQQLPRKELGGCIGGYTCRSVTGTTFGSGLPDTFTGALNEKIIAILSPNSSVGPHPYLAAGKSIGGSSAFQSMIFFEVNLTAIINESDNPAYCFDGEDNDLNEYLDCIDPSCNLTSNPSNPSQRCEYPNEITCNDGYDNDWDGYTDCEDNDCWAKNGTTGPCYAVENYSISSCSDLSNNDYDWGYRCDASTSVSYQTRQGEGYSGAIRLTDCLDVDCNNRIGNTALGAKCEFCNEHTCDDGFDNDVDIYYDCYGNASRSLYERDCDRWHDVLITCNTTEINCSDEIDNDLDSDSPGGGYSWLGIPVYGGWDCKDLDCNGKIGEPVTNATCQWGDETNCEDDFDNDGDGLTDCNDPTTCKGLSGEILNLTGLCRPCAGVENISAESCRDRDDNDYDSLVDCADPDCAGIPGPGSTTCGLLEINCTNLIDDDYDGLIDQNDPDCTGATYTDELGPGQCDDNLDNDDDGKTDCSDSDCNNTMICKAGSYNNPCSSIGYVGAIEVCRNKFVVRGNNLTAKYTRNTLNVDSVVLKLGNVDSNLRSISPILDQYTSFMNGTISNFVKVNDTYGLKAQNTDGFSGALDLSLIATTGTGVVPGNYNLFISTSIPGVYGTTTTSTYVAENEAPTIYNITINIGTEKTGTDMVQVDFTVNVSDNSTYDSGIAYCSMAIPGVFNVTSNSCSHSANLTSGAYNLSVIAYDGALNPSALSWKSFTFTSDTMPAQQGAFYNPYPADNYPNKTFFNQTENLNIGVNFEGGSGFTNNATGCIVEFTNGTDVLSTQYVGLSVISGDAHCTGQADLSELYNTSWDYPSAVHHFTVSVYDTNSNKGTSDIQTFNFCYYYYDNSSGKYRCRDQCSLRGLVNTPPELVSDIPNQTWPRGTKLSVIDLDDYFIDIDNDPLTFTWNITNSRINVSIDRANIITFNPDQSFFGIVFITFYAHDPFTSTPSNIVQLEVEYRTIPPPMIIPSGGGGGGGSTMNRSELKQCDEDWTCTDWGPCLPSGYQFRDCRDRNECGTNKKEPETTRECTYIHTCRDRIRNQGEEGIDCGGPCPPCPSCIDGLLNQKEEKVSQIISYVDESGECGDGEKITICHKPGSADEETITISIDALDAHKEHGDYCGQCSGHIKQVGSVPHTSDCGGPFCPVCPTCQDNTWNQDETGVDCGGTCGSCSSCKDGIRNQGEANIDCGGPCPPCNVRIQEQAFNWNLLILVASSVSILLLMIIALLFGVFKKKFIRLKAKLLNYYMRSVTMFERKDVVRKEVPILQWSNAHLDSIEEAVESKDAPVLLHGIDKLVRIFFKRVFLIRYAFTNDELTKELEKRKIPTVLKKATELLLEELSQIIYGGSEVNKEDVRTLIKQVRTITERMVTHIESKKKARISISERDIKKISETLSGAEHLGVGELFKSKPKGKK
ncbi:MAG: hypothetical protein V1729_05050 [Candidatus Woesearchaeota archaeon]